MARRRPPPLESPHWRTLHDVYRLRIQQTGLDDFALIDLRDAIRHKGLRTMRRTRHRGRSDTTTELLPAAWWRDIELSRWNNGLALLPRTRVSAYFGGGLTVIYVWLPDYKNIFGDLDAQPGAPSSVQEVPVKRGSKPKHPWPEIGHELFCRIAKKGTLTVPKSTKSLADALGDWCEIKYKKAPVDSELRKFIDDVLRALKLRRS